MKKCIDYAEISACFFRFLTLVAIFFGGYVFLTEVDSVFNLAGTQWILIAILFSMLAINMSLKGGFLNLLSGYGKGCGCKDRKCEE